MTPILCIAAMIGATSAIGQTPMPAAEQGAVKGLAVGTMVELETRGVLTTSDTAMTVGQPIELVVVRPVMVGDRIVIAAGTKAIANITSVRRKGMWGQSGGFTAQLAYLDQGGRHIRLNGSFTERGQTGTAGVFVSVELMPLAGFLVTGTSAKLAAGAKVAGFLGEPVPVDDQPTNPLAAEPAKIP